MTYGWPEDAPTWDEAQQDAIEDALARGDKQTADALIAQARARRTRPARRPDGGGAR